MHLICSGCGRELGMGHYRCPDGDGVLEAVYDGAAIGSLADARRAAPGIWRYGGLLPPVEKPVSMHEGGTPLVYSDALSRSAGLEMYFKDEGRNPSGSFKDRAISVMLSVERQSGSKVVTTASSGNAAGALALYSSIGEMRCYIFMFKPSAEKLCHTLSYAATVFVVDSPKEERVLELVEEAVREFDWSLLTTTAAANPYTIEGYKTVAFELVEDLGGAPDYVFMPVGSGTMMAGIWKGFRELESIGELNHMPRLCGVQAAGCNPIAQAFHDGHVDVTPVDQADTVAMGLSLENPGLTGKRALQAARATGGFISAVTESEIFEAVADLPRRTGIFGEPSGVVGAAGLLHAAKAGMLPAGSTVACVVSGNGFKDMSNVCGTLPEPISAKPKIDEIAAHVANDDRR